ncbi:MAG: porin family protein [Proteobacteria bacterium]|nr:porin family protein [Pseudomonadota bacterium]
MKKSLSVNSTHKNLRFLWGPVCASNFAKGFVGLTLLSVLFGAQLCAPTSAYAMNPYFQMNVGYGASVFDNYSDNGALFISGAFGVIGESGLRTGVNLGARMGLGGRDVNINNYSAMADVAYEIPTGGAVRPFVGATGGVIYSTLKIRDLATVDRTDFVYGPMAGITYGIGSNAAIDFTYRYLFMTNANSNMTSKFGGFSIGARYLF